MDPAAQKKKCDICGRTDTDVLAYGPWKTAEDVTAHYYCVLFSADLPQNGEDDQGIDGFLVEDIHKILRAHSKTRCYYCPGKRATVRCQENGCKRIFHFTCGADKKCLNQFLDPFHSYCHKHAKLEEKPFKHSADSMCHICFEPMGKYDVFTSVPSCCNLDYYHKKCIQKYATSFGLLAKCPSCRKDTDGYREFLSNRGIFCPEKDADYVLTQGAFVSVEKAHDQCDAAICLCKKGRKHIGDNGPWEYHQCKFCGGEGRHAKCLDVNDKLPFECRNCKEKQSQDVGVSPRSHPYDAEAKGKVWKLRRTNDPSKPMTLDLMHLHNVESDQRDDEKFRSERMAAFQLDTFHTRKPQARQWHV